MKSKNWFIGYLITLVVCLVAVIGTVVYIDPFIHYHKPLGCFYYLLDNERSVNDGITRHFDYDAIVTGTSMTENFKATEVDEIFGVNCIKVPYFGASYKEIDDNLRTGFAYQSKLKLVIRCLDTSRFFNDKNDMRDDLGDYPSYLYNNNLLDDVNYVLNRSVLYNHCWKMVDDWRKGEPGGITPFDRYGYWMGSVTFGKDTVLKDHAAFEAPTEEYSITDSERETILGNITANVTSLAKEHPDVDFYYFFPPYSAVWWGEQYQNGLMEKDLAAEKLIIEEILTCKNIHLFSWNDQFDLTTNLNNYKDSAHYGEWVNSQILHNMKDGIGLITEDNYQDYLDREKSFYSSYDYNSLFDQVDEEDRQPELH